jgi:hypothetical protein
MLGEGYQAMLSPQEMAALKQEISTLEEARKSCMDSGIQKIICQWIEDRKTQLACSSGPPFPANSKRRSVRDHAKPHH